MTGGNGPRSLLCRCRCSSLWPESPGGMGPESNSIPVVRRSQSSAPRCGLRRTEEVEAGTKENPEEHMRDGGARYTCTSLVNYYINLVHDPGYSFLLYNLPMESIRCLSLCVSSSAACVAK